MMDKSLLGEKLRKLRRDRRLTQDEVCQRVGISDRSLSFYENGVRQPKLTILTALAEVYQVPLKELMADTSSTSPSIGLEESVTQLINHWVAQRACEPLTKEEQAQVYEVIEATLTRLRPAA